MNVKPQTSRKRKKVGSKDVHSCDQCDYSAYNTSNLKVHNKSKHEGIRYPCDQCDYAATTAHSLKIHNEAKHIGIRYPCDQCEYTATTAHSLKIHKEVKHEGIRYPCDQCEYTATTAHSLKIHKEVKHEGIRYPCDQCEYVATQTAYLNRHEKAKHGKKAVVDIVTKKESIILRKKVVVRKEVKCIDTPSSEYSQVKDTESTFVVLMPAETEVKDEYVAEDDYNDPLETPEKKTTREMSDVESKIEIEEDITIKKESSDLSEFI